MDDRKSIRLREYDYSQNGYYFVTMCVKDKKCILWDNQQQLNLHDTSVGANIVRPLSHTGIIIDQAIRNIELIYEHIYIDCYVIMPNHIHTIIVIDKPYDERRTMFAPTDKAVSIPRIIKQFKGFITKQLGYSIWQKSYYDIIIRNYNMLKEIREYIQNNPQKWNLDKYYMEVEK
jgi:hypothetical protein